MRLRRREVAHLVPDTPEPERKAPASAGGITGKDLSEAVDTLSENVAGILGAHMKGMAEQERGRKPTAWRFEMERDSDGRLTAITATPVMGNKG